MRWVLILIIFTLQAAMAKEIVDIQLCQKSINQFANPNKKGQPSNSCFGQIKSLAQRALSDDGTVRAYGYKNLIIIEFFNHDNTLTKTNIITGPSTLLKLITEVKISIDMQRVYVIDKGASSILAFGYSSSGNLAPATNIPFDQDALPLHISLDDKEQRIYLINQNAKKVQSYLMRGYAGHTLPYLSTKVQSEIDVNHLGVALSVTSDADTIYILDNKNLIHLYDKKTLRPFQTIKSEELGVSQASSISFTSDQKTLVIKSANGKLEYFTPN